MNILLLLDTTKVVYIKRKRKSSGPSCEVISYRMMIEISKGSHLVIDDLKLMLDGVERKIIFRAPAKGLYLKKIYYE